MNRPERRAAARIVIGLLAVALVGVTVTSVVVPTDRRGTAAGTAEREAERETGRGAERGTERGTGRDGRGAARSGTRTAGRTTAGSGGAEPTGGAPYSSLPVASDTSVPLRDLPGSSAPRGTRLGPDGEVEEGGVRRDRSPHPAGSGPDPVAQRAPAGPSTSALTAGVSFDGPGKPLSTVVWVPPDPNSAVGPSHVVTVVNTDLVVQSRTGTVVYGPVGTSTVWSGLAGACSTTNDGDAVVRYDRLAARWVITQFAGVDSPTGPYYECVAVSTGPDPTGSWHRSVYSFLNFPDYPKLSVWGDSYVITYNMFTPAGNWVGPQVCGLARAALLAGTAATQKCFALGSRYGSALAADNDGASPPPAGAALPVLAMDELSSTTLPAWTVRFDWTNPAASTISDPTALAVAAFSPACGGGDCIAQPGTANPLDGIGDRLMYRLAYRNFGTHEAMVVAHAVSSGGTIGVRWYELRRTGTTLTVHQQGTYVPDTTSRWMPSVAMDGSGGIALGYALSSASIFPSLAATGRRAGDPSGQMTQPELRLVSGSGSQTGGIQRWGDYFSMNADPSDDCTFWFTGEYLTATGSRNWSTRVASFTLPGCTGTPAPDFSLSASPASGSVNPGGTVTTTIQSAVVTGAAQTVSLAASGLPTGATAAFAPASVTAGGSSVLTVSTTGSTPAGTYPVTVTGTGTAATRTTSFSLVVTASNFSVAVSPTSVTVGRGTSVSTSVSTTAVGLPQSVTLSATGLPSGVSAAFSPTVVTAGSSATLTLTASATATLGSATVSVRGVGTAGTRTASLGLRVLTVNPVGNPGFESGLLTPWTSSGTAAVVSSSPQAGRYSVRLGSTSRTNGDSKAAQTFTTPTGATQLSFWYRSVCRDVVTRDWATATLTDNVTKVSVTVLARTCSAAGTWRQVTWPVLGGRSYTLSLVNRDDNETADPTYTQFDSVVVG